MPKEAIKFNADIFTDALYYEFNRSLVTSVFLSSTKLPNVTPVHKMVIVQKKKQLSAS